MRIDAHQHFWRYNPSRDQWITDEMADLKQDFLPQQLIPELAANQIDGCIAVQADQSEAETLFLLDLASHNDAIQGVVGWVDLCADNVPERLEFFSKYPKLRGFRHIVQAEPDDQFMLRPRFLRGIEALKEFGFTYDVLIYPQQLPAAIELVSRYPEQLFVLDHLAKPAIKEKKLTLWERDLRALAKSPNVYCKVSGMVTEADWEQWRSGDFRPYLDVVFEAFGVDRIMFGSDWPVCLLAAGYGAVVSLVADYLGNLPRVEIEKVFGLNAAHFYGQRAARHAITA
ncbi:MAG TPA: amidohydrolase family protein [Candidatus Angelobacter sp.]|jgi:L-fuconolactonase|nr:amidohydrolase family protein [Candidatus Angelobacter sp.]